MEAEWVRSGTVTMDAVAPEQATVLVGSTPWPRPSIIEFRPVIVQSEVLLTHRLCFTNLIGLISAFLIVTLKPAYADVAYCDAAALDDVGNLQPISCPHGMLNPDRGAFIRATPNGIRAYFLVDILSGFTGPAGWSVSYQGGVLVSATTTFVIRGGTGDGYLFSDALHDAASYSNRYGGAAESFTSNFLYKPQPWFGSPDPITIPFTFDVPFTLFVSDTVTFGSSLPWVPIELAGFELDSHWDATFSVFDSSGHLVSDALVSEVEVSEPSGAVLGLIAVIASGVLLSTGATARRLGSDRLG